MISGKPPNIRVDVNKLTTLHRLDYPWEARCVSFLCVHEQYLLFDLQGYRRTRQACRGPKVHINVASFFSFRLYRYTQKLMYPGSPAILPVLYSLSSLIA